MTATNDRISEENVRKSASSFCETASPPASMADRHLQLTSKATVQALDQTTSGLPEEQFRSSQPAIKIKDSLARKPPRRNLFSHRTVVSSNLDQSLSLTSVNRKSASPKSK